MPKLLFLAHPFPPCPVVGAVRAWNMARYLAQSGWDVTVVTPDPSLWRRRDDSLYVDNETDTGSIRRILTRHSWRCLDPDLMKSRDTGLGWVFGGSCRRAARVLGIDSGIGWIRAAERACASLKPEDVDVILATASPFAAFHLAQRLSDRLERPYVLDYRDPYTTNPHVNHVRQSVVQQEARLLAGCAAATVVSPSWAAVIDRTFGVGSKLQVVTNGYDPEHFNGVAAHRFGHFAIVYSGTFYPPKRLITPVMAALGQLCQLGNELPNWAFHYFGQQEAHVIEEAHRFGVQNRVMTHGTVARREVLSAVRGAGISVVITSVDATASLEDKGIVPAKIFESIGLGTPTLLIAPADSDAGVIATNAGLLQRFCGSEVDRIAWFIAGAMNGKVPEPRNRQMYAWPSVVRKLDLVLRTAAGQLPVLRAAN